MIGTGRLPAGRMLHQRYRLLHTVGQGGMGAVYVAQDTQLGDRLVAVKEMSMRRLMPQDFPQAVEQFRREAHLLAGLHHPNLPVIHEYFSEEDRWYLVMRFIEGQNLQAVLDTAPGKKLPLNEVVRIGIELCEVLDYLHTHEPPIIFRDLKPPNIMVTPKGHICLIDFGIARHFKQEQIKDTVYYYSVGYAPPEQYGHSQTGPRSDIYNLGATLHQMLSGQHPASKPFQFSHLQLVDPTIPMPLAQLIAQMLEMNEQNRPASVAEVKAQLENVFTPGLIEPTRKAIDEKEEQARLAEEERARQAEAEHARKVEEQARQVEAERVRKAEEEQARLAEVERQARLAEAERQARLTEAKRVRRAEEERIRLAEEEKEQARLAEVERQARLAEAERQARLVEAKRVRRAEEERVRLAEEEKERTRLAEVERVKKADEQAPLAKKKPGIFQGYRIAPVIVTGNMFLNVWGILAILGILHYSWWIISGAIVLLLLSFALPSLLYLIGTLCIIPISIGWGIAGWLLGPSLSHRISIPSLYLRLGLAVIGFLLGFIENSLVVASYNRRRSRFR